MQDTETTDASTWTMSERGRVMLSMLAEIVEKPEQAAELGQLTGGAIALLKEGLPEADAKELDDLYAFWVGLNYEFLTNIALAHDRADTLALMFDLLKRGVHTEAMSVLWPKANLDDARADLHDTLAWLLTANWATVYRTRHYVLNHDGSLNKRTWRNLAPLSLNKTGLPWNELWTRINRLSEIAELDPRSFRDESQLERTALQIETMGRRIVHADTARPALLALFEGASDISFVQTVMRRDRQGLSDYLIDFGPLGGKGNRKVFIRALQDTRIPCAVIFDLDAKAEAEGLRDKTGAGDYPQLRLVHLWLRGSIEDYFPVAACATAANDLFPGGEEVVLEDFDQSSPMERQLSSVLMVKKAAKFAEHKRHFAERVAEIADPQTLDPEVIALIANLREIAGREMQREQLD